LSIILFLPGEFDTALRKLDSGRLELTADDILNLTGRQHIIRRVGEQADAYEYRSNGVHAFASAGNY
jgi:hypothetical protein